MFPLLHQYLIENSELHFPGIGTLVVEETTARLDVANQELYAPKQTWQLQSGKGNADSYSVAAFLSGQLGISEEQSWAIFNQFSSEVSGSLAKDKKVEWQNVGTFQKKENGEVLFVHNPAIETYLPPVKAERIIRQNAEHLITVGDTETTNIAMQEFYEEDEAPRKRDLWWVWALLILVVSVALIWMKYKGIELFNYEF